MPRPAKCRRVCHYPKTAAFSPAPVAELRPPVVLTVDEYEAIRLIDAEGFSQEQCSQSMEIARTTVQKIYESARKKLAAMLVEGRPLQIEGGAFRLCDGRGAPCGWRPTPSGNWSNGWRAAPWTPFYQSVPPSLFRPGWM